MELRLAMPHQSLNTFPFAARASLHKPEKSEQWLARVIPRDVDSIIEGGNSTAIDNIIQKHGGGCGVLF